MHGLTLLKRAACASLMSTLALTGEAWAGDQPQLGQRETRNMVSEEKNLPDTFDPATGKNIKWSIELGTQSYATPIVANGRVFIGTNNDNPRDTRHQGDRNILLCLNEADGKLLWQLAVPKLGPDIYLDWTGAGLVSPPTVEEDRVYVFTNRDQVVCLDINGMANGNDGPFVDEGKYMMPRDAARPVEVGKLDADILWMCDLMKEVGVYPHDGGHGSPLIKGDLLYVNTCNGVDNTHRRIRSPEAPSLVAIDKRTGRIVAKDDERIGHQIVHNTWSSPAFGTVNGKDQVFFCGGNAVVFGFEALKEVPAEVLTFNRVWRFDCDPQERPADHRYMGNRRESPSNIKSMPVFHDGKLYVTAGGDVWWGKRKAWLKCIDPTMAGDVTGKAEVWSYEMAAQCCSTPAIADGLIYVADTGRTIHCVDAKTGKAYWTHQARGDFWASPLVADGKVYVGDRRGQFTILAAGKEKKVLSQIELGEEISGTATAANGVLYVATMKHLYAVQAGK
jgi:outer membrane protein assembly factor BamB